ncbi:lipoprotein [Pontibacter litorisediminis]|uniref:lipoprotein n=1 Tax=Pontibacter litorisediminis TaxID=1846260 RepID=UPI0023EC0779|nr:lipoprotein [Pontibacter litorisediminis]
MKRYILPLLALLWLAGCNGSNTALNEKLKAAVTEGEAGPEGYKTINMAELTDFDWDMLYFFQPNEDEQAISDVIGFTWDGAEVPENHRRLLFVKGEEVVSYVDYYYNDFPLFVYGCGDDKWVYPKSRSEFASFKYCSGEQEIYTFIPVPCVDNIRLLMDNKCPEKNGEAAAVAE